MIMTPLSRARQRLATQIIAQERWIREHGGGLAGYVQRYGSETDPEHHGDGGEAIYTADYNELSRLCMAYQCEL